MGTIGLTLTLDSTLGPGCLQAAGSRSVAEKQHADLRWWQCCTLHAECQASSIILLYTELAGLRVDYDDNDSAARRITEEAFEGSLGDTENGDAASHAAAAEEIESHPSPAQDGKPQKTSPSSDGANKPAAK